MLPPLGGLGFLRVDGLESGVEEPFPRLLEQPVGEHEVAECARGNTAELAADIGYRACMVGHEVLVVAQLLWEHDAGTAAIAPTRPRGLDALPDAPGHIQYV